MIKLMIMLTLAAPVLLTSCGNTASGGGASTGYFSAEKVKQRHLERMAKLNGSPKPTSSSNGETLDQTRERGRIENNKISNSSTNPYIRHQSR